MGRTYFRPRKQATSKKKIAPDYGTWWLDFTDASGRRRQERCPARTQADAEDLLRERAQQAYRLRKGLELESKPTTFSEAAKLYRESIKGLASYPDIDAQLRLYLEPKLGRMMLAEITPADCDAAVAAYADRLKASTRRALLTRIGALYDWAQKRARIHRGDNPARVATRIAVPHRVPRWLSAADLGRLIDHAEEGRLPIFVAALTGLRKGELAGLRWDDVDLDRAVIIVRRSYDRDTTKGRKDRLVPMPTALVAELKAEKQRSKSALVFPAPGTGGVRTEAGWDLAENMKVALVRAGLVKGWVYRCIGRNRSPSCGFVEERPTKQSAKCPGCGKQLWPRGIPIAFAFKDLRSTYATHLAIATGDIRLVQRILGHSTPSITETAYAAAGLEYLRAGIEKLPFGWDTSGTRPPPSAPALNLVALKGSTK